MASTSKASTSDTGSKGAFDEIAPSVSISASKRTQKPCYDVFINHRGPDVKHTLASVLYGILTGMQLSVFLDSQESEYGDFLPRTIEAAMTSALVHIAIFSKGYADSPWCLAELSFMLKSGATIIPIFYHIDPGTDLRWVDKGKGMYVQAFKEHERKGRYSPEKLQEWKSALHVVSFYHGEIINTNEDEMRLQKNIVSRVLKEKKFNVPLVVAKYPVGLKEIVEDFKANTFLSAHANQDVQLVGIWGMGGSGKTTLTKELYNEISSSMDRSSFVFNVRDAASKGLLHEKQKKLLNDLGIEGLSIDNVEEGMQILSRGLRSIKVLIILDDVDNVEQLDALLPTKDSLERGSLIIVTTRTYEIFKSWDISSTYKMRPLNLLYAKQLFCSHAFLNFCPPVGFEELVEKFLKICHGLPLSLKVFGAQLHGESSKEYWESQLNEISRIVPSDIKNKLKISYDALNDEEKKMFLDAACFFIGEESSLAIEVWNGLGWSGQRNWERLLHKCLVELDDNNLITMHDHLRDMGRDIANKQSPYRFWIPHQIINVQNQKKKKIGIQGIIATSSQIQWRIEWGELAPFARIVENSDDADEFRVRCSDRELMVNTTGGIWLLAPKLVGLKYFVTSGDYFNQVMGEVSRELVWLRWFEIEQRKLSLGLSLKKLRVLELHESSDHERKHHLEELWGESNDEVPVQLRQLFISHCYRFQGFPKSIGLLNHLKKIVIINCRNVESLPDEFCLLQTLEHLVFRECYWLSSLPSNFGNLSNLRHLGFWHCFELKGFPVSFKNLMLLEHLNLGYCEDLTFTSEEDLNFLENISKLEYLNLSHCKRLEELPHHITNQTSLRMLDFSNTRLRVLPENIGQLSRLREMTISEVLLTSLPTSFGDLSLLTNLVIRNCSNLECLPDSLGNLSSLTNLKMEKCYKLKCLPDSLGDLSCLINLEIIECSNLKRLPDSLGDLSSLTNLVIDDGSTLECLPDSLGDLSSLTFLDISRCFNLENLPHSVGDLSSLTNLKIGGCHLLESLPDTLGDLSSLKNFEIVGCFLLESLPDTLGDLSSLINLEISFCNKLERLPDSLGDLSSLMKLEISWCPKLDCLGVKSLPKPIRQLSISCSLISKLDFGVASLPHKLSNLKEIHLCKTEVRRISFSDDCFPHLQSLHISENHHLMEIEALPSTLLSIYLEDSAMLRNIASFAGLSSLREFDLKGCYGLEKIEGLENCTRLEQLRVETFWEVPGIERLEHMQNLKRVELRAEEGSFIERCIQMIQKWPDEIMICARAIPDAASLVQSLLSPSLVILASISNQHIISEPRYILEEDPHDDDYTIIKPNPKLDIELRSPSNCGAFMFCFVIDCFSSEMTVLGGLFSRDGAVPSREYSVKVEKGRWVLVGVFTQCSTAKKFRLTLGTMIESGRKLHVKVEKGLVVRGKEQTPAEAVCSLLPLLQS